MKSPVKNAEIKNYIIKPSLNLTNVKQKNYGKEFESLSTSAPLNLVASNYLMRILVI